MLTQPINFSEKSKKMIKDMGNVELFELCETIPKVQYTERFLTGINSLFIALAGISWKKVKPVEVPSPRK